MPLLRERRQHVVYITRNSEYHCRSRECVGVRDRTTGVWRRDHPAVRARLIGAFHPQTRIRGKPDVGQRLVFSNREIVMTSKVLIAGRPDRSAVFSYTSLCRAGEITTTDLC
jgi:hypothetical protein